MGKYKNKAYLLTEQEANDLKELLNKMKIDSKKSKITVDKWVYHVVEYNYPINKEE